MTISEDQAKKLEQSIERLERVFGQKSNQVTVEQVFDQSTIQRDTEIMQDAMQGYSDASSQERQEAEFRTAIRGVLSDPQIQQAAQKEGVSYEEFAKRLVEMGYDGMTTSGGKKKTEYFKEVMGIDPNPPKPRDSFFEPGHTAKTPPQNVEKARKHRNSKEFRATDDDMDIMLKAILDGE